jgi:hypothetical protein
MEKKLIEIFRTPIACGTFILDNASNNEECHFLCMKLDLAMSRKTKEIIDKRLMVILERPVILISKCS